MRFFRTIGIIGLTHNKYNRFNDITLPYSLVSSILIIFTISAYVFIQIDSLHKSEAQRISELIEMFIGLTILLYLPLIHKKFKQLFTCSNYQ